MTEISVYAELVNGRLLVEALGLALLHSLWQGILIGLLFKAAMAALANAGATLRYWSAVSALMLLALCVPSTMVYLVLGMLPAGVPTTVLATGTDRLVATAAGAAGKGFTVEAIVAVWVIGVTVISVRTLTAWFRLSGLRRAADRHAALPLVPVVERLAAVFGLAGRVDIGLSESINSPVIVGWLKPVILLPPAIVARLPHAQLEMIIAHELAHLRRHDHWINLFQVVTETLMFYHPAVTMISRQIRIERESACDDLAVSATCRRLDYVEMLASLEKSRSPRTGLALGVQDGQVLTRIRRLVERSEPRAGRGTVTPVVIALLSVSALLAMVLIDDLVPPQQTAEPAAAEAPGAENASAGNALEPGATSGLSRDAGEAPGSTPPEDSTAAEMQAGAAVPAVTEDAEPPLRSPVENQKASAEIVAPASGVRPDRTNGEMSGLSNTGERERPSEVEPDPVDTRAPQTSPAETSPAKTIAQQARSAPGNSASSSAPAAENGKRTNGDDAEQAAISRQIETPRLDPSVLLARRAENPVLSPAEWLEREALTKPEQTGPQQARPLAGDAQRATKQDLAGGDLLERIQPSYPLNALRREISGSVEVELQVGSDGRVVDVEILDETPARAGFGAAARDAASQWKFEPLTQGGTPVVQRKIVVFEFELGNGCRPITGSKLQSC